MDRAFTAFQERGADERRLAALLDACHPLALGLCARILGNREDAEDAAQLVLIEVAQHAAALDGARSFRRWFYSVCRARAMDVRRRRARRESHEARAPRPEPANGHGSVEARRLLHEALVDLSDEDRALVLEHYFDRIPLRAIAERRGCSKVAVWKRLERIRATLLRKLGGTGLALIPFLDTRPPAGRVAPSRDPWIPPAAAWTVAGLAGVLVFTIGMTAGAGLDRNAPERQGPVVAAAATTRPVPILVSSPSMPVTTALPHEAKERTRPETDERRERDEFRELVRRLFRQIQNQRKTGRPISPEFSLEISPLTNLLMPARRDPARHAEEYAHFVVILHEVGAEEAGNLLSSGDRLRIERLRDELAAALRHIPPGPPAVRLLAAVEADLAFARGMADFLPRDVDTRLMLSDVDRILKRGKRKSMPRERLAREIVADWTASGAVDGPTLAAAAGRLSSTLARITEDFRSRLAAAYDEDDYSKNMLDRLPVAPYDPVHRLEYQVEALKAQIEALQFLRGGLDPDQAARLLESEPWNYAVSRQGVLIEARQ